MNTPISSKLCFAVSGFVAVVMAAVGFHVASSSPSEGSPIDTVNAVSPLAVTVNGPGDVAVVSMVYEPGQSSGWHTHAGIHAVAVLSGTLTVYDGQCRAQHVRPGEPYVGGQELHLARNDTDGPVEMIVTHINPSATAGPDSRHVAGPACTRVDGQAR